MTPLLSLLADALAHPAASDRGAALCSYVDDPRLAADTLAALREASAEPDAVPCCYCGKPWDGDEFFSLDGGGTGGGNLPLCNACAFNPDPTSREIVAKVMADRTKASADACPHCGLGADLCPHGSRDDCAIVNSLPTHGEVMALPGHAEAERREHPSEPPRCERCHWPLKATVEEGCTVGNCSYRGPKPEQAGVDAAARLRAILARRTDGVGNVDACGVLDDVQALVRRGPT